MADVIVFDVNETLLDLAGLDGPFGEVFGERAADLKRLWFARLVHTSTVVTMTDRYEDLGVIGRSVLTDLAARVGLAVNDAQVDRIMGAMRALDPHPDVVPGLQRLAQSGNRLVALTNGGQATAEAQLAHAGIDVLFERILSVDAVGAFKPDRRVYDYAAAVLEVPAERLLMVATHDWDCAGAMAAGWHAAFLGRPGQTFNPLYGQPTHQAADLSALAQALLA